MYVRVEEWLGKENQLGIDIWKGKYQYEGETFEDDEPCGCCGAEFSETHAKEESYAEKQV